MYLPGDGRVLQWGIHTSQSASRVAGSMQSLHRILVICFCNTTCTLPRCDSLWMKIACAALALESSWRQSRFTSTQRSMGSVRQNGTDENIEVRSEGQGTWCEPNDSEVEIARNRTQTLVEDPAEARKGSNGSFQHHSQYLSLTRHPLICVSTHSHTPPWLAFHCHSRRLL